MSEAVQGAPDGDTPTRLPPRGRLLGVDFGTVRVGLAVSDPDRLIASPLDTRTRAGDAADAAYFAQVVAAERVVGLVVGLPLHARGNEGTKAAEARQFGAWLGSVTGLPVVFLHQLLPYLVMKNSGASSSDFAAVWTAPKSAAWPPNRSPRSEHCW